MEIPKLVHPACWTWAGACDGECISLMSRIDRIEPLKLGWSASRPISSVQPISCAKALSASSTALCQPSVNSWAGEAHPRAGLQFNHTNVSAAL